jgi:hypothetical protein
MNPDIERMAKEAGLYTDVQLGGKDMFFYNLTPEKLAKFAALIAEECAKEAELLAFGYAAAPAIRTRFPMPALSDAGFLPFEQWHDASGYPLSGGLLEVFDSATGERKKTYRDPALAVPNTFPIVLDVDGRPPGGKIWLPVEKSVRLDVYDYDRKLVATYQNLTALSDK